MGNEMGNQNASGIKGEENEATDQKEKVQEAAPDGDVKGENHIIPEGESKDYHEKAAELSNHDMPSAIDSDLQLPTSNEREEDVKEPKPPQQFPEVVLKDKEELVCEDGDDIKTATARDGNNREEFLEGNVEDKTATNDIEVLENKQSAKKDLKSEAHESTDVPKEAAERAIRESKETEGMSAVGNIKENGDLIYKDNGQDHCASVVLEDDDQYEEVIKVDLEDKKSLVVSNLEEKCDFSGSGCTVETGVRTEANGEMPPEMKSGDSSESNLEDAAETSSLDCINDESIDRVDEVKLIARESENGENKHDLLQNEDAADSNSMTESCQMDNVEESSRSVNSATVLKEAEHAEEVKVINDENQTCFAGDNLNSLSEAEVDAEEVIEMMPEVGMPTGISIRAMNKEEEKATEEGMMENAQVEKDEPYAIGNGSDEEGRIDKHLSPLQSSKQGKCLDISKPDASDVKVGQKRIESSPFLNANDAIRTMLATDGVMENQEAERELEQKIHSTPETLAEAELPLKQPHEQYANGEATLSAGVVPTIIPESVGRQSVESNPEKPCDRIELRKCPSFDFGIPLDARSEESDQTPLLRHDKTVYRSFSSISNATFHSENGRSSLDYEPVVVEEKTIRMERSDSDNSRAPFFSSTKKDDTSNAASIPQKEESHVGSKKVVNESGSSSSNGHELASPRGSGKRKPKSSLFSTCLCCTAAIS